MRHLKTSNLLLNSVTMSEIDLSVTSLRRWRRSHFGSITTSPPPLVITGSHRRFSSGPVPISPLANRWASKIDHFIRLGYFWKVLGTKILTKVDKNIWQLFVFKKASIISDFCPWLPINPNDTIVKGVVSLYSWFHVSLVWIQVLCSCGI